MSRNIQFLSLQKSELEYEVAIRGETPGATVVELRKQIVIQSRLIPSEDILESHLTAKEDLSAVKDTLTKITSLMSELRKNFEKNLSLRIINLLTHLHYRLTRIQPTSAQEIQLFGEYRKLVDNALAEFSTTTNVNADINREQITSANITVNCDKSLSSDVSKLKFDGRSCVRAFIEQVNEFVLARKLHSDKILSFASEIFTDNALHWCRSIRDSVKSWDELIVLLKQDFDKVDYDYLLLNEIRLRTQGANENITIYFSIMQCMFARLSKSLSELDKLEILLHNIRPCYANVLAASPDVKTVNALRTICKNYEDFQTRFCQFQEPPKVSFQTLAPEFAYNHPTNNTKFYSTNQMYNKNETNKNFASYSTNNQPSTSKEANIKQVHAVSTPRKFCPRCRVDTHNLRNCTAERKIVCFRCGKPEVRFHECPQCQNISGDSNPKN